MSTQHGSPFELSGRLAVLVDTTSKDFPSHTQLIGKSLESISAWRGQLKKELEVKDSDILASKTSVELLYEKVHEVEKEKRILCSKIDKEVPKRVIVAEKFGHLQAALQAASDHSGRLRAVSDQYPKAQKDQTGNRNFLNEKLQNLLKTVASFKTEQESSRKILQEKVTAVGRKEALADRNYTKLRTEEESLVDDVKGKIAGIAHFHGRLQTPNAAVQDLNAEFVELDAKEEQIMKSDIELQNLILEISREADVFDREMEETACITAQLEAESEEYRKKLIHEITKFHECQQKDSEDIQRSEKTKTETFEKLRIQKEKLVVLRENNLESRKNALLELKTVLEERNKDVENSRVSRQSTKERVSSDLHNAEQEIKKVLDKIVLKKNERILEEEKLKIQLQHLTSTQDKQTTELEEKSVELKIADSTIKLKKEVVRQRKTDQDAQLKFLRDLEASEDRIKLEIQEIRVKIGEVVAAIASKKDASVAISLAVRERQEEEAGASLDNIRQEKNEILAKIFEASSLIAEAESEKASKTSKLTVEKEKERRSLTALETAKTQQKQAAETAMLKKKTDVNQERTERTVLVGNSISPKVKAIATATAAGKLKRHPAQPDPLESPSKRSHSGVPHGRVQNVEEEPRSWSEMSQSSDDSNVSYHVPMRVAPADMPKIPPNFGRLTLSFNDDEEPQREFMTLDDY